MKPASGGVPAVLIAPPLHHGTHSIPPFLLLTLHTLPLPTPSPAITLSLSHVHPPPLFHGLLHSITFPPRQTLSFFIHSLLRHCSASSCPPPLVPIHHQQTLVFFFPSLSFFFPLFLYFAPITLYLHSHLLPSFSFPSKIPSIPLPTPLPLRLCLLSNNPEERPGATCTATSPRRQTSHPSVSVKVGSGRLADEETSLIAATE